MCTRSCHFCQLSNHTPKSTEFKAIAKSSAYLEHDELIDCPLKLIVGRCDNLTYRVFLRLLTKRENLVTLSKT